MASTFLLESEVEEEKFPLNPIMIQKEQEKDKKLQKEIQKNSNKYKIQTIEGAKLVTYKKIDRDTKIVTTKDSIMVSSLSSSSGND
jgi:hypothetical protein